MALDADYLFQAGLQRDAAATLTTERDLTTFDALASPLATFELAVNAVLKDANLSPQGKQNAIAAARQTVEEAIAAYSTTHEDGLTQAETTALKAIEPATAPNPDTVRSMLDAIRGFEPTEIASLYASASDPERIVIEAASAMAGRVPRKLPDGGGVAWMPLLDLENPSVVEMRERRLERLARGTAGAELHDLRRLRSAHRSMAGGARALVNEFLNSITIRTDGRF